MILFVNLKRIVFILSLMLFFACGGSKKTVQKTNSTTDTTTEKDSTKIAQPIEEKSTNLSVETTEPTEEKLAEPKTPPVTPLEAFDHTIWNTLLQKHVSENGAVDYKGFKNDQSKLKIYLNTLAKHIPTEQWSRYDTLAYWINVYNTFTVALILDNYPINSIKDIKNPWDLRFIKLGAKWYTLNDIEHTILRKMEDPRIHFGINCASISCPKLLNKAFTAQNVDTELENLTIDFINNPEKNTISANKIEISKLFTWFAKDFKTKGTLIDFLNTYSKIRIHNNAKKSFKKYNWQLNE